MKEQIFRKYDIRGIVGQELCIDDVYDFGCALAYYFKQQDDSIKTVVIGMDGRVHSAALKEELASALQASGFDVLFIGVCTTPVVYFTLHRLDLSAGVMITASHNEKEYNGFKICCHKEITEAQDIQEIFGYFNNKIKISLSNISGTPNNRVGSYKEITMINDYVAWLCEAFNHLKGLPVSCVLDCVNGAAGSVIPQLVKQMEWKNCTLLHAQIDGTFPVCTPDPKAPENVHCLTQAVQKNGANFGIAFDGDADRMVPLTKKGQVLAGDKVLTLISEYFLQQNPGASVVFDGKCSVMLSAALEKFGAQAHRSATGCAYVKKMMRETGALLGGELSCHFMFADRYFGFDDGIYAMLRFIEFLAASGKPLQCHVDNLPVTYQSDEIRIQCAEECKQEIVRRVHEFFLKRAAVTAGVTIQTFDGVRIETHDGWGVVRASNTQPVMSFSCESQTPEGFLRIKNDFEEALASSFCDNLVFDFDWKLVEWRG